MGLEELPSPRLAAVIHYSLSACRVPGPVEGAQGKTRFLLSRSSQLAVGRAGSSTKRSAALTDRVEGDKRSGKIKRTGEGIGEGWVGGQGRGQFLV